MACVMHMAAANSWQINQKDSSRGLQMLQTALQPSTLRAWNAAHTRDLFLPCLAHVPLDFHCSSQPCPLLTHLPSSPPCHVLVLSSRKMIWNHLLLSCHGLSTVRVLERLLLVEWWPHKRHIHILTPET